ncbi:MAG: aminotransferase class I/II-fold pyridoxal phosphate-dependent enzyme [Christensenellales bacterium]|jgi:arginine/lysine/ornithine decarboxylase
MNRQTPIMDAMAAVADTARVRLCMPGHKGDTGYFGGEMLWYDITELPGADNLIMPAGAIQKSQALHAEYVGADIAAYITGGSTTGILAMLSMFRGKKVIFPRGVHLSAANAVFTFGIQPVYLDPPPGGDYPGVIRPADVRSALKLHRDAAAVFITYPNYFGLCCDIEAIAEIAHKSGVPLLVDAAHGAHFAYSAFLPTPPGRAGADVWVESAHKMLPAMNQCACLYVGKNALVDQEEVLRSLRSFQTTSPSYLLLGSLDYVHAYMRDKGESEMLRVNTLARRFEELVNLLPGFYCPEINVPDMAARDPLKVVVDVSDSGYTGLAIKAMLARQGIHVEAADLKNLLLMLSVGTTAAHLDRMYEMLKSIERIQKRPVTFSPYAMPKATKYIQNARFWGNIEKVRIDKAVGLISAVTAGVYPPAEAVVGRGQQISQEIAGYLLEAIKQGFDVFGAEGEYISVYKERK